jgi:predicted DNA-binding protein
MEKEQKKRVGYRFSGLTVERLDVLAKRWEASKTHVIEQLIRKEFEESSRNSRK